MSPRPFLALARRLAVEAGTAHANAAPLCRCAIGRAYYAAYNAAVDFLNRIGFETTNSHACHMAVQYALNQSNDESLRNVSTFLNTLHGERRLADYELRNPSPENVAYAGRLVDMAEEAFRLIEEVEADTSRWGPIATAVLNYVTTSQTAALRRKSGARS